MADDLAHVDWQAPWFDHWRVRGERVAARRLGDTPMDAALNEEGVAPLRFVPDCNLPQGSPYEQHIFLHGECPTRDNLHDFFNGLCWMHFPLAKKQLNALQASEISRAGVDGRRGPLRDAITVFDENGALLHAAPELWEALRARDWRRLFIDLRPLWQQARLIPFGHALLEKLVRPRKDITAHVWAGACPAGSMEEVDGWLSGQFDPTRLAGKPFAPLPVLGVPGWWPENQNFSFYDDSLVFRPAGQNKQIQQARHASRT